MPHLLFVTGKLAEPALRRLLADLGPHAGFSYTVTVLPITVAALATTPWVANHLQVPSGVERVILPGLCGGDLSIVEAVARAPVERGPKDLRDLPEYLGAQPANTMAPGAYDIEILAEINHAPRMPLEEILALARRYRADGADIIDLGCDPGDPWMDAGAAVRALRAEGMRVSLDTFQPAEAESAARAGAELILSVNRTNRAAAPSWGCAVVAVPDAPGSLDGLEDTATFLENAGIPYRLDPVLEPIGFGLAQSLNRYVETRRRFPHAEMLMGVGNLTELTEVDSAAVNVVLAGFCQELGIRSVLTTEVIHWCRSCVRELDLARRLVHHACVHRVLPKHLGLGLVLLRDPKVREHGEEALAELASRISDRNFRLFAERGQIHAINDKMHLGGTDPFKLFQRILGKETVDPAHAFYLGYEMAKAVIALKLGKNYVQDEELRWGFLNRDD
jgi:dihydropteroate synthase-like protein